MTIPNIILLLESEVEIKLFPLIILSIMEQNISIIDGRSGGRGRGGANVTLLSSKTNCSSF
jgi:hypothetical protein